MLLSFQSPLPPVLGASFKVTTRACSVTSWPCLLSTSVCSQSDPENMDYSILCLSLVYVKSQCALTHSMRVSDMGAYDPIDATQTRPRRVGSPPFSSSAPDWAHFSQVSSLGKFLEYTVFWLPSRLLSSVSLFKQRPAPFLVPSPYPQGALSPAWASNLWQ